MKIKAKLALFHCGRCGKDYSSPLGHVCAVRRPSASGTRLAVKATVTRRCPSCKKPANNPLTHVCAGGSDFKRRKKAAEKKARAGARASAPKHLYQQCRDKDCKRLPCVAWKEALAEGFRDGEEAGYAKGYSAGVASCG